MAHIKRLVREVKRYHNEMESDKDEQLIYYFPQENNLEIGYALIIGPDDTPYHNCFYLVKMTYSRDYPNVPPKCEYMATSGIRQSPNLYEDGKICLSLIGTWGTSTWKASKGFLQILKSIQAMVLVKNSLDCEPPYDYSMDVSDTSKYRNAMEYEEIVRYSSLRYNTSRLYHKSAAPADIHVKIQKVIGGYVKKHYKWYINHLTKLIARHENKKYTCTVYTTTHDIKTKYSQIMTEIKDFLLEIGVDSDEIEKAHSEAKRTLIKSNLTVKSCKITKDKIKKEFPSMTIDQDKPKITIKMKNKKED